MKAARAVATKHGCPHLFRTTRCRLHQARHALSDTITPRDAAAVAAAA
jgi:hypothetical protein